MSLFLGTTSGTNGLGIQCAAVDWSNGPQFYRMSADVSSDVWDTQQFYNEEFYANPFWPGGSSLEASGNEWMALGLNACMDVFANVELTNGQRTQYAISGVTRDVNGSPLSGCTVKLFITSATGSISADTKIDEVTSNANGAYTVMTPFYPDQHYIVVFRASAPHVFGASDYILVGA
jgi:hypothetical protein